MLLPVKYTIIHKVAFVKLFPYTISSVEYKSCHTNWFDKTPDPNKCCWSFHRYGRRHSANTLFALTFFFFWFECTVEDSY